VESKNIFDRVDAITPPEYREDVRQGSQEPRTSLNMLAKILTRSFLFFPESTKFHLFHAALLMTWLTGRMSFEATAFLGWFMKHFPHFFNVRNDPEFAAVLELAKTQNFDDFDQILIGEQAYLKEEK
jgi:hypothetical protein